MLSYDRSDRFNEEIKRGLTEIFRNGVKDPRVPEFLSITRVETTRDLSFARVYVSAILDEMKAKEMMKFFKDARGYLRRELSKTVLLRQVPELSFIQDRNIEHGVHIADLLRSVETNSHEAGDDNVR